MPNSLFGIVEIQAQMWDMFNIWMAELEVHSLPTYTGNNTVPELQFEYSFICCRKRNCLN